MRVHSASLLRRVLSLLFVFVSLSNAARARVSEEAAAERESHTDLDAEGPDGLFEKIQEAFKILPCLIKGAAKKKASAGGRASIMTVIQSGTSSTTNFTGAPPRGSGPCASAAADPAYMKVPSDAKPGYRLSILRPACFADIRASLGVAPEFVDSLKSIRQVGAGSGFSGAQHYITTDGRFYMKGLPDPSEVDILKFGSFLGRYANHVKNFPSTLLVHFYAIIVLDLPDNCVMPQVMCSWKQKVLLVMDNTKREVQDESSIAFDLKGSEWKHRIMSGAGRRCNPFFTLSFFEKRTSAVFSASGEDGDFYALRTHAPRLAGEASQDLVPLHDECVMPTVSWVKAQNAQNVSRFCGKFEALLQHAIGNASLLDFGAKVDELKQAQHLCNSHYGGKLSADQGKLWATLISEQKYLLEGIRRQFNYPSTSGNKLQQLPLGVDPWLRNELVLQLERDVNLLGQSKLLDYSMDLVIKYDAEDLDCAKMAGAGHPFDAHTSIFAQYKGGIRAAAVEGAAENAVYIMRIMDFLASWKTGKRLSKTLQGFVGSRKVNYERYTEALRMLLEDLGAPVKCKNPGPNGFCWTSCSSSPKCPSTGKESKDGKDRLSFKLAEYDFSVFPDGDPVKLDCSGNFNGGMTGGSFRALCVTESLSLLPRFTLSPFVSNRIKAMSGVELNEELLSDDVKNVLTKTFHHIVSPDRRVPENLKRIALMIYEDFARRPFGEDTEQPAAYAERFLRFFKAWIKAPPAEEWDRQCPRHHWAP